MVDTERMRRVLERMGPKLPIPPPPPSGSSEFLRWEEELTALSRRAMAGSRGGREILRRVIQASGQRQRELHREYYRERGRPFPPMPSPPPGPPHGEGPLSLVRRAWQTAGELEEGYGNAAEQERNRERKQLFRRLERSAGESRRQLRGLLDRGM